MSTSLAKSSTAALAVEATARSVARELTNVPRTASRPVLYAACRSDQTSADATFDNRSSGAFTHHLLQALTAGPQRPRKEILTEVTAALRADDFSQRPTLEGPTKARATPIGQAW